MDHRTNMDLDLRSFLASLGFSEDELDLAFYELDQYRSIPGTTLKKYLRRAMASADNRTDFLKGLIAGTAIQGILEE